jgi:adenylate cyclase
VPNPLSAANWPVGMQFRFETFIYFFVFLATATLAYSWQRWSRWVSDLGRGGRRRLSLPAAHNPPNCRNAVAAVGSDADVHIINPHRSGFGTARNHVFLIVAMTLALAVRRSTPC